MRPLVVIVMGVSGCGKSTIAGLVAERLHWDLLEGDELHPKANVEKMSHGIPLDDNDRRPWLEAISRWIDGRIRSGRPALVTCSSLKRSYRDILRGGSEKGVVAFAHLSGSRELLMERMKARKGHFMPASLLDSQLATLEPLQPDETGIVIDIGEIPAEEADQVIEGLHLA
ncbi:gluconokinase [Mesorhizobium sp. UC22_110]|uniref:gluconokinase n=1 Tax=unclassified Mesorhizobium TaxID=325217 RepID=UPI00366E7354